MGLQATLVGRGLRRYTPARMPQLVPPSVAVHASYLAGLGEFRAEGRLGPDDNTALAAQGRTVPGPHDAAGFARYIEALRAEALPETPRPEG